MLRGVRLTKVAASLLALAAATAAAAQPADKPASAPADPFDDAAFEAELPPLDQTAAPAAPSAPVSDASAPLATTPATAVPTPAAAEVDPELTQPLPSIGSFDTTPPPATAADADEKLPEVRYRLTLTGLKEIGLEGRFRELSVLEEDGKKAANSAQIGARAEEDEQLAIRLMTSEGYYDAIATAAVDPLPDAKGLVGVTITATPGKRYKLGEVAITGTAPDPARIARDALALKTGDPIVAAEIEGAEARVSLRMPEQGYPFVTIGERDIVLDDADYTGDYTLPVDTGPKARYRGYRVEGDPVFDADHIALLSRFDPGEVYDSREVDDLRQALIATSLLSTVSVEPVKTGQVLPDGSEEVDLLVRQAKGPWRSLAGSAGYGTGEGIKLMGSWTHRNLFPTEGALSVAAVAGTLEQSLGVDFRRSNAGQRDRTFRLGGAIARQNFDAYNARTFNLSASLSRQSTPIWQKKWTWSVGAELIATSERGAALSDGSQPRDTYLIAALPLQIGYDSSDSLLDPTRGYRLTARISPEASLQGGFSGYGRMLLEGSTYYPVSESIVLAGRARVGSILGAGRTNIAPSRRFYSGGGGSVRGFGFQELGPKDFNNDPIGGRSLTEFALEARYRFGNFGIVPFFDAGRVGTGSTPSLSGMRYGAGIGGRYYTNFGPMRVDIATPINRQPGESKIALYISIGQAF